MSTSIIEICNSALFKLGAERISSLTENRKEAQLCAAQYNLIRKKLLRSHPWNFAIARATLGQDADTPIFDYAAQYQLPSDCLRVIRTANRTPFNVEGRLLLSDDQTVSIMYIKDVTDVSKFDPTFAEVLSYKLAEDLAIPLVQSVSLKQEMARASLEELRDSRSFDGQEGANLLLQEDVFLDARVSGLASVRGSDV